MRTISLPRLVAIGCIFIMTTVAWFLLSGVIQHRTKTLDRRLRDKVSVAWGGSQEQRPPTFNAQQRRDVPARKMVPARTTYDPAPAGSVEVERSDIAVALGYEPRQKGLLWYNLYTADFIGRYTVKNYLPLEAKVGVDFTFPNRDAVYDGFSMAVDGQPLEAKTGPDGARIPDDNFTMAAGAERVVEIRYRSQGLDRWQYALDLDRGHRNGGGVEAYTHRNLTLTATTNFADVDFPDGLSPTEKRVEGNHATLVWRYENLVSGKNIAIGVPKKLNPGPHLQRVTLFAPVSLFLFFVVLLIIMVVRNVPLHPMHFFFLAAAFFSFHLLSAYLADHVSLQVGFLIAAAVSLALVVSYLRLVTGWRFALVEAGIAQCIYLVAFSYSFFFEGKTGLMITILSIATLFALMQITGRLDWGRVFAKPSPPAS